MVDGVNVKIGRHCAGLCRDHGVILSVSSENDTVVLDVRYKDDGGYYLLSPYPPLVVPTPRIIPAKFLCAGARFVFSRPVGRNSAKDFADPNLMSEFDEEDLWWLTADLLERYIGVPGVYPMTADERSAVIASRPGDYAPTAADLEAAALRLSECTPIPAG